MRQCRGTIVLHHVLLAAVLCAFPPRTAHAVTPDIADVGPRRINFSGNANLQQSTSGKLLSLAISADGSRLYAGCYSGLWRSDDSSAHWTQMVRPQPEVGQDVTNALWAPDVWDIAVSPLNRDIMLVYATGDTRRTRRNGIYRSQDGGATWTFKFDTGCSALVPGEITFAPDNPNLVYAAAGCQILRSPDGGVSWNPTPVPEGGHVWHIAVGPMVNGARSVFAAGPNNIYYLANEASSWQRDLGVPPACAQHLPDAYYGDYVNLGMAPHILAVDPDHPGRVYLAASNGATGPCYFHPPDCPANVNCANCPLWQNLPDGASGPARCAGEGSLWIGDFSGFATANSACWSKLPGPPVYWGDATASGSPFVYVQDLAGPDHLVFFSDKTHVFVAEGPPGRGSWHRLDGNNLSDGQNPQSVLRVHMDPHGFACTPDLAFRLTRPTGVPVPYDSNTVVSSFTAGTIWMVNDGGVSRGTFDAANSCFSWASGNGDAYAGSLHTLELNNLVGAAMTGQPPALYFGTGDNDDFVSLNAGANWDNLRPAGYCGDCSIWFVDPAVPGRVVTFPRFNGVFEIHQDITGAGYATTLDGGAPGYLFVHCPPDATGGCSSIHGIPRADDLDRSYQPLVRTMPGETPPVLADLLVLRSKGTGQALYRIQSPDALAADATSWDPPATVVTQAGPDLPAGVTYVQSSGGHGAGIVYYVGDDAGHVWRWPSNLGAGSWKPVFDPGTAPGNAIRLFVNPYNPNQLYVAGPDFVRRSDNGGDSWPIDVSLDNAVTEGGVFDRNPPGAFDRQGRKRPLILEMDFDREEPGTRFAIGNAGVSYTLNGLDWVRFFSTTAMPSHPTGVFFDRGTGSPVRNIRDLYVGVRGRGILRMSPVPALQPPQPAFCWVAGGTPAGAAAGAQDNTRIVSDGSGGTFIAWKDRRSDPGGDIYAQHLLADGSVASGWDSTGMPVCIGAGSANAPALAPDGAGGVYVAWQDGRATSLDLYAQRIRGNGTIAWMSGGLGICTATGNQDFPAMLADSTRGCFVAWRDHRGSNDDIYAVSIDTAGSARPGWPAGGAAMCSAPGDQGLSGPQAISDGAGGMFLAWQDARNGISNWDVYAQHASAVGTLTWDPGVCLPLCTRPGNQLEVALTAAGSGAAVASWTDSRTSTVTDNDIFLQRFTVAGPQWAADGVAACDSLGNQSGSSLCASGAGNVIVAWEDQRSGATEVYAQRFSSTGNAQWSAQGVRASTSAGAPHIAADGLGGALLVWQANRLTGSLFDVWAQRLEPSGAVAAGWPAAGFAVSTADDNQRFPVLAVVGDGRAIVAWQDRRNGLNDAVYTDCLTDQVTAPPGPILDVPGLDPQRLQHVLRALPNPSRGSVTFEVSFASAREAVGIDIFDIAGRRIRSLRPGGAIAGVRSAAWDGRDASGSRVASGVYLVRASTRADSESRLIVIVR